MWIYVMNRKFHMTPHELHISLDLGITGRKHASYSYNVIKIKMNCCVK